MNLPLVNNLARPNTTRIRDLDWYDYIVVSFSGGKDSAACMLGAIKRGVPKHKIIGMHQHVDGLGNTFMDWPCTESYCRAFCKALGIRLLFQWRHGGFEREMLKENDKTAPVSFDLLDGGIGTAGGKKGKISTRRLFPQVTADLSKRWCSASLKIDVGAMAINNEPAFKGKRLLFLSGERREEGRRDKDGKPSGRAAYAEMEQHRTHTKKRHVDHWRMVIDWTEEQVWDIMREFGVTPHPAYRLGWGRVSCLACIFGLPDQWASVRKIAPQVFERIACLEMEFGKTIHQGKTVVQLADRGKPYPQCEDKALVSLAMGQDYPVSQILTSNWQLPAGAFKRCGGPL